MHDDNYASGAHNPPFIDTKFRSRTIFHLRENPLELIAKSVKDRIKKVLLQMQITSHVQSRSDVSGGNENANCVGYLPNLISHALH